MKKIKGTHYYDMQQEVTNVVAAKGVGTHEITVDIDEMNFQLTVSVNKEEELTIGGTDDMGRKEVMDIGKQEIEVLSWKLFDEDCREINSDFDPDYFEIMIN